MNIKELTDDLKRDEGMVLHAYTDSLGFITIGIGRLIDERRGGGISEDEAEYLLRNDIARVVKNLDFYLPWWKLLSEPRQRVLANMCFNLGIAGLLTFKRTLAAVKEGRYSDAADGMLQSKWAKQVGNRAKRLAEVMRTGQG